MNKIKSLFNSRQKKIIFLILVLGLAFAGWKFLGNKKQTVQYQTAKAEKGTLVISVAASGQISTANSASVTTQTSGVVNKIYVENGQQVKSGDPIAEVDLDMDGQQRATQALASYQGAKNSLDNTQAALYSSQSTLFTNWKTYMDIAQNSTYQNPDGSPKNDQRQLPQFMSTNDDWLAAEAKYKNQQNAIATAQTSVSSAWASYQKSSPVIYAPISGTISGLSLQIGSVLTAQTTSSGNSSSQRIANIKTSASPTASVNLTEIDVPKVKIGNKVTLTMDALLGKTYTGKIVSIDTTGVVSSGVTNYSGYIKLDSDAPEIYPNMSVQANIITQVKDNALLVPVSAVQTQNSTSTVRVMKNNQVSTVNVETGLSTSTEIEIVSGLSEGDTVVTNSVSTVTGGSSQSSSPFSLFGGGNRNAGGAGGAIRRIGGD